MYNVQEDILEMANASTYTYAWHFIHGKALWQEFKYNLFFVIPTITVTQMQEQSVKASWRWAPSL